MNSLTISALVLTLAAGCFEPKDCEITPTEAGSLIQCPDGEVLTKKVSPGAKCFSEPGKIACDDGNEFELAVGSSSGSDGFDMGDGVLDVGPDVGEPGNLSACSIQVDEIVCSNGARALLEGVSSSAVCQSRLEPGLGRRIVCESNSEVFVLVPTLGSVDGVEPTCEVKPGGELVSCNDGTAFSVATLAACPVADAEVSLDANEAVSVACGGSEILLIPKSDYCRDVAIDSDESLDAFVKRRCLYVYGDLTMQGVENARLDELFLVSVSGTLTFSDLKSVELLPSMLAVGALVVRDNENLKGFKVGTFLGGPNSFYVEKTVEVTNNKRLQALDMGNVRRIGESWVTSGNQALEFMVLPALLNHDMDVFMCVDNESLPHCEVTRVWDWGESHAKATYIGNNGDALCHQ